jgi:hypothetical protein
MIQQRGWDSSQLCESPLMATQPMLIIGSIDTTNHGETKECTIIKVPPFGVDSANYQMRVRMSF